MDSENKEARCSGFIFGRHWIISYYFRIKLPHGVIPRYGSW